MILNKITILYIISLFNVIYCCQYYTDCNYNSLYNKTNRIIKLNENNPNVINCINKYGNKIFKNNEESYNHNINKRSRCNKLTNLPFINRMKKLNKLYSCLEKIDKLKI